MSLGFVSFFYEWNWAQAEAELKRGIELAPSHANAHHWYWSLLMCTGRRDEARREIRRAVELDPLSPLLVTNYGLHHHLNRNYERALEQLGKALELEPAFLATHLNLWRVHELRGAHDEAVVALRAALRAAGHDDIAAALVEEYPRRGYGPALAATADRLANEPASRLPIESSTWMYLADGQIERALAMVEEAFEKRRTGLVWMAVAPDWDPLEKEPRFHQILELVGLPPRASVQLPRPA